jgi:hypothetical protein
MAHFVKRSKHPMNCLSNHRLIGLLIRRGMGIFNDPLPEVEEQPNSMPDVMANPEQPNHVPSTTPAVKSPTITARKLTPRTTQKTRSTSNTTQKIIDSVEPEQLNPIPAVVLESKVDNAILGPSHEPQPLAITTVVEELTPTPKAKKRKYLATVSTLPKKRTRSERSTATTFQAPTINSSTSNSSLVEPATTQNPPNVATIVQAPTVTANELS